MKSDINDITAQRLCTGCASCKAVCPAKCISMEEEAGFYSARIDAGLCIHCGLCLDVCPQTDVSGPVPATEDDFAGPALSCFTGTAADNGIRTRASSGGIVSALGLFAMETGLVDGIVSVVPTPENPLRFKSAICRGKEDFLQSAGSKYCPVAQNTVLEELLAEPEGRRFMYIGLPCHIKGLMNVLRLKPALRKKIYCILSLFCGQTPSFKATEFILAKKNIAPVGVSSLTYRGRGWPGGMHIEGRKPTTDVPLTEYWNNHFGHRLFTARHCLLCDDLFGRESDLALGDAWLPEFQNEKQGISIGIVRTEKGQALMDAAIQAGALVTEKCTQDKVFRSQSYEVTFKHKMLSGRKRIVLRDKSFRHPPLAWQRLYNRIVIVYAALARHLSLGRVTAAFGGPAEKLFIKANGFVRTRALNPKKQGK